ncbi:homeobox protein knotted-1-like 6, partial [Momordica charantia]|uniref:Homeobox protein knotted-1-like 6 n=1 Tax=Momordica charantia TaxID=3673 RepID=A0A6J1DYJ6_MOMCH
MEEMYGLQSTAEYSDKALMSPENLILPPDYQTLLASSGDFRDRIPVFGSNELLSAAASAISEAEAASITPEIQREDDFINVIKAKISSHPSYPRLLHAYIDCQKVGAPPEIAQMLEEIRQESDLCNRHAVTTCLGVDPELDEFM